jgi:RNA polymerase sigma factor (sigma-70 family)
MVRESKAGAPPFQAFLDEHRVGVYRFLLGAVGPNEVDDCFQETFLAALRAYPRLRHGENLRGWIFTIAARKAIDVGRSWSRKPLLVSDPAAVADPSYDDPEPVETQDPLWMLVRELPPRQRVALVHRVVLDRPYTELAATMGCSVETARANVHHAIKKLKEGWVRHEAG